MGVEGIEDVRLQVWTAAYIAALTGAGSKRHDELASVMSNARQVAEQALESFERKRAVLMPR